MSTTQKRPRVPENLASMIDERRGETSFEEYVRKTLSRSVGSHYAEPAPDSPKQRRLLDGDGEVKATGIPPRNVPMLLQDIALAEEAANALYELGGNLDAAGNVELAGSVEEMADWLIDSVLPKLYPLPD